MRDFYEEQPYRAESPRGSLAERVAALERDWAAWAVPVTMRGRRTLDVGCGCGAHLVLHGALAGLSVGVDVSRSALVAALGEVASHGLCDRVFLLHDDIRRVVLPAGAFDVVTCVGVLHHVPDHAGALAAMARLLAPGGALLLGVYHPAGRFWHRVKRALVGLVAGAGVERRVAWARRLFDVAGEARRYRIPEPVYVRDSYAAPVEKSFSVVRLAGELEAAGLSLAQVRPSPCLGFADPVDELARRRSRSGLPIDGVAVDRELARLGRHHYWALATQRGGTGP